MEGELEQLWTDLLSENAGQISRALFGLSPDERQAVLAHLGAMAREPGWSDGQARRARAALAIAASNPQLSGDPPPP